MLPVLILCWVIALPVVSFGQVGTSMEMGNTTFYNFNFGGVSGSSQSIGKTDFII
jgi:hypothetical protein